jgi:hypothetical protein
VTRWYVGEGVPQKGLTEANKQKRIQFANPHRNLDHVLFTERNKFHFKYLGAVVRPV